MSKVTQPGSSGAGVFPSVSDWRGGESQQVQYPRFAQTFDGVYHLQGDTCRWETGVTVSPSLSLGTWVFLAPARSLTVGPPCPQGWSRPALMPFSTGPAIFGSGPLGPGQFAWLSYTSPLVLLHVHFSSAYSKEFASRWRSKFPTEGRTEREGSWCA